MIRHWSLHAMHLVLGLSLTVLLASLLSCTKLKEEKMDYGPEIAGTSIDVALSKAIGSATLNDTRVGAFIHYNTNRRVENNETVINLGETRVDVIDRVDTADSARFTLRIARSERQSGGTFDTRISEEPLVLKKTSLPVAAGSVRMASIEPSPYSVQSLNAEAARLFAANRVAAKAKVSKITYHNLKEWLETRPAPETVRNRPGCGGLSPCEIPVNIIAFDLVQWYDDGSSQKIAFDFAFSVKTPYIPYGQDFNQLSGLMVMDCRATYIPIDSRLIYIRDCQSLEDFEK